MRRLTASTAAIALLFGIGACSNTETAPEPNPTTDTAEINAHEAGPASPIGFGLSVPKGAVQLGPLVRFRSPALIAAYQPELEAVQAEQAAENLSQTDATPSTAPPSTSPSPTATNKPEGDSFADLDSPPRPDSFVSVMRIDGDPTPTVRRMLAQLAVLVPDAKIVSDDLSAYCQAADRRISNCRLDLTGTTPGNRRLRVQLTVDPGSLLTRTGSIGSLERPVMTVQLTNVGDPRKAQENRDAEKLAGPQDVEKTSETSGWIWPKMDEDAPATGPVIDGFVPPSSATVLLSADRPQFATMTTARATIATEVAATFMAERVRSSQIKRDVISDLNEVIITTWGTDRKGRELRTVHTLSARGNYLTLFVNPAK